MLVTSLEDWTVGAVSSIRPITRLPNYPIRPIPSLWTRASGMKSCSNSRMAYAIGHARDEVARGGVDALCFDRRAIEKLVRALPHLLPETATGCRTPSELRRRAWCSRRPPRTGTLRRRKHGVEHRRAHPDLGESACQRVGDDVLHQRRRCAVDEDEPRAPTRSRGRSPVVNSPARDSIVDVVVDIGDEIRHAHDLALRSCSRERRPPCRPARPTSLRVLRDAVADFPREVEARGGRSRARRRCAGSARSG